MIPIVLYLRMSDLKQDTSIEIQRQALRAYAKAKGFRIVREYVEEGISGDDTKKRVAFQQMISDSARGDFKGILCRNQDRFGRFDPLEAGYWIQPLRERGVWLETVEQGRIDWETFMGRLGYIVQQEGKKEFLITLSKNVCGGMWSAAQKGLPLGALPRGYKVDESRQVVIDELAAEAIRQIFRLYVSGLSCRQVAERLNALGVKPSRTKLWTRTTIHQALVKEYYTGTYVWNANEEGRYHGVSGNGALTIPTAKGKSRRKADADVVRIADHHPAIIDAAMFERAQRMLKANRKITSPRRGGEFAFSGLLICGACGAAMHGRRYRRHGYRRQGQAYYVCSTALHSSGCRLNSVCEEDLRREVLQMVGETFCTPRYVQGMLDELRRRSQESRSKDNVELLKRQLQSVRAKVKKATERLLQVDRDMIKLLQEQVRELVAEEARLAEALELAETPIEKIAETELQAIGRQAKELIAEPGIPADVLRRALRKILSRVTVHVIQDPQHRQRFKLSRVELLEHESLSRLTGLSEKSVRGKPVEKGSRNRKRRVAKS